MADSYDVIVIGGGPGGYVCAIRAAQLGLRTLCVERAELGGVCLNWGCIPTKALIKSAELIDEIKHADKHGIKVEGFSWDLSKIVGRSRNIAGKLNKGIAGLFKKYKVEHLAGNAVLTGANTIEVTTNDRVEKLSCKNIVIATGARPKFLPELKPDGKIVITSREAMVLNSVPKHLLVVGGGAIGIEFAYFYSVVGARVTIVEYMDSILPGNDREIAAALSKSLTNRGIKIVTSAKLDSISTSATGVKAKVVGAKDGKELQTIDCDICLSAVGMTGNIENLGLEKAGIATSGGFISIDAQCRTSAKNIFAIGDVSGFPLLAHKASYEGHGVAELISGLWYEPLNRNLVPGCTYCHPQLAFVGLTEEQCKAKQIEYVVGRFPFSASGMALAAGEEEGVVKLIFGRGNGELLGAHVLAARAADLIAELGLAIKLECIPN